MTFVEEMKEKAAEAGRISAEEAVRRHRSRTAVRPMVETPAALAERLEIVLHNMTVMRDSYPEESREWRSYDLHVQNYSAALEGVQALANLRRHEAPMMRLIRQMLVVKPEGATGFYCTSSGVTWGRRTNVKKAPSNYVWF